MKIEEMPRLTTEIHPFLTKSVLEALQAEQIYTALDFVRADTQQVVNVGRLTFREVLAIRNFLLKKFSARPTNGLDCYRESLHNTAIVPTGMKGVDKILQGGLITGNIYELCGLPASGKTRFVATIMKNAIQNTQQHLYLLDTKNDFSVTRIKELLHKLDNKRQSQCLARIWVNRSYNRHDVINTLYDLKKKLEGDLKLRVIIMDSLPSIFMDSNDPLSNNTFLNYLVNVMRIIAVQHHVAFLVVNLISTWNDFGKNGLVERVHCGKYWAGIPNTKLKIEKLEGTMCKVTVLDNEKSAEIQWSGDGFV